jgi:hypothetical protein
METYTGEVTEHLFLGDGEEVTVTGSVSDGATLGPNAMLTVQGNLTGKLTVGRGACANVQGNAIVEADIDNTGLLLLTGNIIFKAVSGSGAVGVTVGSLIDGKTVMESDGSQRPVRHNESLTVNVSVATYRFLQDLGPALSLAEIQSRNTQAGN